MTPLFKKLNFKDQEEILVLNAPESFESELQMLDSVDVVSEAKQIKSISFAIYFVTTLK